MRPRWRASVLAAAGAATLLAGCGIRVAAEPSPSPAARGDRGRVGAGVPDGLARRRVASLPPSPTSVRPAVRRALASPSGLAGPRPAPHRRSRLRGTPRRCARGRRAARRGRRRRPARAPGVRPARRRHGRAQRRARRGRGRRRRRHGHVRALLRPARDGPARTRSTTTRCSSSARSRRPTPRPCWRRSPARASWAGTSRCARVWPGFRLSDRWATRESDVPRPDGGAQRSAGVRRRRAARLRLRRAPRCCGGCATCLRPPASAPRTRRRTPS